MPPVTPVLVFAHVNTASPQRSSLPDISPFQLKPAPSVFTLSFSSAFQLRHGSILALAFLSVTVAKQPPDTMVLPATPPTVAVLVIAPAL